LRSLFILFTFNCIFIGIPFSFILSCLFYIFIWILYKLRGLTLNR
jgi:hypothetical protein